MNIVVLDGGTTNPGDLSWAPLEALGALTVYEDTPAELVLERSLKADALIVNRIRLDEPLLAALPRLRYVGTLATGYNTIDVACAKSRGVTVCNVPNYCEKTVAQMTFALLLALCNHVDAHSALVKAGRWRESIAHSGAEAPWVELSGKTLGILGYGSIGRAVAAIGRAMGMEVIAHARTPKEVPTVSLTELFTKSHVVSIHCPLTPETRGLVDRRLLRLMKPQALLLNTARGAVVNEEDLALALREGWLAGAGLDVLAKEPPPPDHPLFSLDNCLITPHIAWSSPDARRRLIAAVADNLRAFRQGRPQNAVG